MHYIFKRLTYGVLVSPQIATLESELTQLMKQNGIQVNNNNSNSTERLNAQQQSPRRAALQTRGMAPAPREGQEGWVWPDPNKSNQKGSLS